MTDLGRSLSLRSISAFNLREEGRLTMVLKAYYDGSGKAHDPNCRKVTLGGYVATEGDWPKCEAAWETVLGKYPHCPKSDRGNPYFHSKEAFHRQEGYWGWEETQVIHLVYDLVGALAGLGRMGLIGFSCTVDKPNYEAVKLSIPAIRRIEAICIDHCIGNSFRHPSAESGMEIWFDRKEEFEPILKHAWNEEVDGKRTWWAEKVLSIAPVADMRDSYALQAADLLAWVANRYHTHGPDDKFGRCLFSLALANGLCHSYYDEAELLCTFNPDGTMRHDTKPATPKIQAPTGTRISYRPVNPPDPVPQ